MTYTDGYLQALADMEELLNKSKALYTGPTASWRYDFEVQGQITMLRANATQGRLK